MAVATTHFKVVVFLVSLSLALSTKRQGGPDLRCLKCDHIASPSECDTYGICGHDEICFVREYIDHHDKLAYHMGCESASICALYKNAEQIFVGRRDVLEEMDDGPHYCFDCCNSNDCNTALCSGRTGVIATTPFVLATTRKPIPVVLTTTAETTTTRIPTTATTHSNGCPQGFVKWITSCYLFDLTNLNWNDARTDCQSHGADLVSVNTGDEDSFIVSHLNDMNPPDTIRGMWIGGIYDDTLDRFKWVDGNDITFRRYKIGSPRKQQEYRLLLINPAVHGAFQGWPWASDIGSIYKRGHICEKSSTA